MHKLLIILFLSFFSNVLLGQTIAFDSIAYIENTTLRGIDKGLAFDRRSAEAISSMTNDIKANTGRDMPVPSPRLGFATSKNIFNLVGAVKSYIEFVTDPKALLKAEKWAQKLVELDESKENLTLYARLLHKMERKKDAEMIEQKIGTLKD